jgi:ABC-2 type transport system permease protein
MPNIFLGVVLMGLALWRLHWAFDAVRLILFLLLFVSAVGLAYSFLLLLCSTSLWFVRNQSLMELWWLFTTLMRHPREIFKGKYATPLGRFFTFVVPILLVVSVPAGTMVKALEPGFVALTFAAGIVLLVVSRWFFRFALRSYRSASS